MEERIKSVMADILTVAPESIDEQSSMNSIERWDSLAQINLVTALEQEFGVSFEVQDIELMTSFADILDVLTEKL